MIYVRFERGRDDLAPITFGPYEDFIQVTYNFLRTGPDGDHIAYYDNGDWQIMDDHLPDDSPIKNHVGEIYSDFIVYTSTEDPVEHLRIENEWFNTDHDTNHKFNSMTSEQIVLEFERKGV